MSEGIWAGGHAGQVPWEGMEILGQGARERGEACRSCGAPSRGQRQVLYCRTKILRKIIFLLTYRPPEPSVLILYLYVQHSQCDLPPLRPSCSNPG